MSVDAAHAAVSPTLFLVSKSGSTYVATPSPGGTGYSGTLKSVVESAVADLEIAAAPGSEGTVRFTGGDFDLGSANLELYAIHDLTFEGAGAALTTPRNSSGAAADTEPFDVTGADRVTCAT